MSDKRSSTGQQFIYECWSCGKSFQGDEHDQKWVEKHKGRDDKRLIGPCCAYGGYFGGS